jgi:hypothetical protein
MQNDNIEQRLVELEKLSQDHLEAGMALLKAGNAKMYAMDLFCVAIFKRSMSLISGFCLMIRNKNFVCAAPIIRMQLDNALRFQATFLIKNPDDLVKGFINGTHISNFKDSDTGQKLTDGYLVKQLELKFKGVTNIYKHTSGYIHLSEKHLFNALKKKDGAPARTVEMTIGSDDFAVTDNDRLEAIEAMIDISKVLLWFLSGWTAKKDSLA